MPMPFRNSFFPFYLGMVLAYSTRKTESLNSVKCTNDNYAYSIWNPLKIGNVSSLCTMYWSFSYLAKFLSHHAYFCCLLYCLYGYIFYLCVYFLPVVPFLVIMLLSRPSCPILSNTVMCILLAMLSLCKCYAVLYQKRERPSAKISCGGPSLGLDSWLLEFKAMATSTYI